MTSEFKVECPGEEATKLIAQKLSEQLVGGEIIELIGDLGSGKTTFVKGLAEGLETSDDVSSPSFALHNIYNGRLKVHHFDLYRLGTDLGVIIHDIRDAISEPESIVIIEWAKVARKFLPKNRIIVNFYITTNTNRELKVKWP